MQTKSLIEQIREAQLLNRHFGWGMPESFFQIDLSNINPSEFNGNTKVLSFYLPEGNEISLERTFKALISFIEEKSKRLKMKFSISEELRNPCGRIHYHGGWCHRPGVEAVSFNCRDGYDGHDGVVVGKLTDQAGPDERFLSAQLLWALVFSDEWAKGGCNLPKIAMAGYSFWPTRSFNDRPKTLVLSISGRDMFIEAIETNRHIFSSVPRLASSLQLLTT